MDEISEPRFNVGDQVGSFKILSVRRSYDGYVYTTEFNDEGKTSRREVSEAGLVLVNDMAEVRDNLVSGVALLIAAQLIGLIMLVVYVATH